MFELPPMFIILVIVVVVVLIASTQSGKRRHGQVLCRACGASHPSFARFCRRCGRQL